jgi:hypothetical protein
MWPVDTVEQSLSIRGTCVRRAGRAYFYDLHAFPIWNPAVPAVPNKETPGSLCTTDQNNPYMTGKVTWVSDQDLTSDGKRLCNK